MSATRQKQHPPLIASSYRLVPGRRLFGDLPEMTRSCRMGGTRVLYPRTPQSLMAALSPFSNQNGSCQGRDEGQFGEVAASGDGVAAYGFWHPTKSGCLAQSLFEFRKGRLVSAIAARGRQAWRRNWGRIAVQWGLPRRRRPISQWCVGARVLAWSWVTSATLVSLAASRLRE